MATSPSSPPRPVATTRESLAGVEVDLTLFGEPDDHLRAAVLLALRVGQTVEGADRDRVEACTQRGTSWAERLDALEGLLRQVRAEPLCIGDVDALYQGPKLSSGARWRDATFRRERSRCLEAILTAAASGAALTFVRTSPHPDVAERMVELGVEVEQETSGAELGEAEVVALAVSPQVRPVARWLLQTGVLRPFDLQGVIEAARAEGGSPDDDILAIVDDVLPSAVELAAHRLSLLRPPQALNGAYGPLPIDAEARRGAISREAVETLIEVGILAAVGKANGAPRRYGMPGRIRRYLARRAAVTLPDHDALHAELGAALVEAGTVEATLEGHHHAIRSGDVALARASSDYYVSDLRLLAYRLSRTADSPEGYLEAAGLYDTILEADPTDAYAWEYLGFNLAMAHRDGDLPASTARRVERAYGKAAELEPSNPLYAGRLLGWRAERGEDVSGAFERGMRRFHTFGEEAPPFFAKPVFDGLKRAGRVEEGRELMAKWWPQLLVSEEPAPPSPSSSREPE